MFRSGRCKSTGRVRRFGGIHCSKRCRLVTPLGMTRAHRASSQHARPTGIPVNMSRRMSVRQSILAIMFMLVVAGRANAQSATEAGLTCRRRPAAASTPNDQPATPQSRLTCTSNRANASIAPPTRRRASRWCGRLARRRACSEGRGVRRHRHLGVGRLCRRVHRRPGAQERQDDRESRSSTSPTSGFCLHSGEKGEIYFRLFSYVRYLNQRNIDASYTDSFGVQHSVQQRQDIQLAKFFSPFSGWFLTPKFRYYLYVWSSNASQGDPAQVVGAGNLSYVVQSLRHRRWRHHLAADRAQHRRTVPCWLGVDGRLIADEFFRGSSPNGVWVKGDLFQKLKYNAMFATNLSILGVSASQIDNKMDTQSFALHWLPTTGEFGLLGTFGDYDYHEKVATRVGVHWSHSLEDKQSQPSTNGIENSQIRLTDGSIVFTPDLFGKGIAVNNVDYKMTSIDAGVKYAACRSRAKYYRRWLTNFTGVNTGGIPDITDNGYQLQSSAMVDQGRPAALSERIADLRSTTATRPKSASAGTGSFTKQRGLRLNGEFIHVNHSPVGYTAYPMPVGANGNIFHINLEMNF